MAGLGVDVPGGTGGGVAQLGAQVAHLGYGMGEEAGDLSLQRPSVGNLAQRCIGGQRQQVAGYVKGARLEGAFVGLWFHRFRTGNAAAQGIQHLGGGLLVDGKKVGDGFRIELRRMGIRTKIWEKPA